MPSWPANLRTDGSGSTLEGPGWDVWGNETDKYNPRDDFNKSVEASYEAIKERVADGGPGWEPK